MPRGRLAGLPAVVCNDGGKGGGASPLGERPVCAGGLICRMGFSPCGIAAEGGLKGILDMAKRVIVGTGLAMILLAGCVERRLTINTDPQGAKVVLNDQEIGTSPVTVPFHWYGDYWVRL